MYQINIFNQASGRVPNQFLINLKNNSDFFFTFRGFKTDIVLKGIQLFFSFGEKAII